MNFWQIGVLALLALIALGLFHGIRQLSTISKQLSRQLSNLFMLNAAAHKFPLTREVADQSCDESVVDHTEQLEDWKNKIVHAFLAEGMTLHGAFRAADAHLDSQARWIAENAPKRIENGCHNQHWTLDLSKPPDEGSVRELCPTCAENLAAAEAKWAKLMEEEKVSGKMLAAWEYIIPVPPCPTSLEEYIAKRKKCLNDFNAEYGTKYSKEPEQKNKTVSKREAP